MRRLLESCVQEEREKSMICCGLIGLTINKVEARSVCVRFVGKLRGFVTSGSRVDVEVI